MASIIREVTIQCDAAAAWDALSDFGALHQRLVPGFVTGTRLDGADTRVVTFYTGAVARERLIGIDHDARRLAYTLVETSLNPAHHSASAQVIEDGNGRIRFVWISDVLPDELSGHIAAMMDRGIATIKQTLEHDRPGGPDWERRLADAWSAFGQQPEAEFLATVNQLASELPSNSAIAAFERAAALDSTGHPDRAVPLYRQALTLGLTGERRRRGVIQLASSLRNVGDARESAALLRAELDAGSDHLDDAVRAFLALALADAGNDREAVSLALGSLARHLPRYQRSLANYAEALNEGASAAAKELTR